MEAPFFSSPVIEKGRYSTLHFLNEGVDDGGTFLHFLNGSTLHFLNEDKSSTLHFLCQGMDELRTECPSSNPSLRK